MTHVAAGDRQETTAREGISFRAPGAAAGLAPGALVALVVLVAAMPAAAQWVQWTDETATRLSAAADVGVADLEEKDYAWGDVDLDGDLDLVVVRKEPFTSPGKRTNVLFLNENGVLVDRTALYAVDADVPGDQGFLTATNDRDVQLADLNDDGWLDIVTAVTISDDDPKHIGHPRIYLNLGEDAGSGDWLGFRYRANLIPELWTYSGLPGFNPRFCSVAVGDVNGDDLPDLWFGDYDSSGAGGFDQPEGADFNDRLLLNSPQGRFTDNTSSAFSGLIQIPNSDDELFPVSAFGAAAAIADINGDGRNDVVKQTALVPPQYVGVSYNAPLAEGSFTNHEVVYANAPYFVSVGDLNNDSRLDLVVTDDGQDRYLINQGNDGAGRADFVDFAFQYDAAGDDGFGSNSVIVDLDNDGWQDVLIADVDVDEAGCGRRMHIFRNQGGNPGDDVILREETTGSGCGSGNPSSCLVAGIPADRLTGVHDVAAMDLDGDGWQDLVIGRCGSTEIWMNRPPFGLEFSFPSPIPDIRAPAIALDFQLQIDAIGGATIVPGSETVHVSVGGGPFVPSTLTPAGGGLYDGTLPPSSSCLEETRFYVSAEVAGGGTVTDPPTAPTATYSVLTAFGKETVLAEGFEGDVSAWTVVDQSVSNGSWEAAVPEGTITGGGAQAAPDTDDEPDPAVRAFVTENGAPGGSVGAADLDGGPTDLISPPIDLAGSDATISYSRWFYNDDSDVDALEVAVSVDGTTWIPVETVQGQQNAWTRSSFRVGAHVTPGAATQVRFRATDTPNNSITEAAVDRFLVERFVCAECVDAPDCDDGDFCNGAEVCNAGSCEPGPPACPGQACDEDADVCLECVVDGDCDDGDFCNGVEICSGNTCLPGSDPCSGGLCDEQVDACVACLLDTDCDDGLFCNGAETCDAGVCSAPVDRCPGQTCDEDGDVCVGNIELQPRLGDPLAGLTVDELQRFEAGRVAFNTVLNDLDGLGPIFNQNSCSSCHNNPVGGSGSILVTRFGFNDEKGGGFDGLEPLGGTLLQANAIEVGCEETVPAQANVTTMRLTNSTLGFGLVEAIADADLQAAETFPPPGVSGRAHIVELLEDPGTMRVGRFGWKSQVATMLSFSADAALNEMGLTNRLLTAENAPNGDPVLLADCDDVPDPEDGPDGQGFHFIDRVADFQRFLAPPPQTPRSGMAGEAVFNAVQCASCHTRSFTTPDDPALEDALRNKVLRPYSDFLLHDMGQNADFIPQGQATARELRTAPLWGVRVRDPLWHDGRVAGGTFDGRIRQAIALHDSLGSEGQASAQAFDALPAADQDALVAFLDSLGRAEFDHDGDGDVDLTDHDTFQGCFTGPGSFLTPDDACSVSDVDRDGDVDDDDFALFDMAVEAPAGRVPDGSGAAAPLRVGRSGGDLVLTWDGSCNAADDDYAVYQGTIGEFAGHTPRVCSTGGATTHGFEMPAGDLFFLVVPRNDLREGSYGTDGAGGDRPASTAACVPRATGACL